MKDLTTEQYRLIYDQPVYPKNLYLERAPYTHAEYRAEVIEPQVRALQERGVYARPGVSSPGVDRQPVGIPGLGAVPVADGVLVDLPAQIDLAPVAQRGEVDQPGVEIADE
jgi:hypothetical protein